MEVVGWVGCVMACWLSFFFLFSFFFLPSGEFCFFGFFLPAFCYFWEGRGESDGERERERECGETTTGCGAVRFSHVTQHMTGHAGFWYLVSGVSGWSVCLFDVDVEGSRLGGWSWENFVVGVSI